MAFNVESMFFQNGSLHSVKLPMVSGAPAPEWLFTEDNKLIPNPWRRNRSDSSGGSSASQPARPVNVASLAGVEIISTDALLSPPASRSRRCPPALRPFKAIPTANADVHSISPISPLPHSNSRVSEKSAVTSGWQVSSSQQSPSGGESESQLVRRTRVLSRVDAQGNMDAQLRQQKCGLKRQLEEWTIPEVYEPRGRSGLTEGTNEALTLAVPGPLSVVSTLGSSPDLPASSQSASDHLGSLAKFLVAEGGLQDQLDLSFRAPWSSASCQESFCEMPMPNYPAGQDALPTGVAEDATWQLLTDVEGACSNMYGLHGLQESCSEPLESLDTVAMSLLETRETDWPEVPTGMDDLLRDCDPAYLDSYPSQPFLSSPFDRLECGTDPLDAGDFSTLESGVGSDDLTNGSSAQLPVGDDCRGDNQNQWSPDSGLVDNATAFNFPLLNTAVVDCESLEAVVSQTKVERQDSELLPVPSRSLSRMSSGVTSGTIVPLACVTPSSASVHAFELPPKDYLGKLGRSVSAALAMLAGAASPSKDVVKRSFSEILLSNRTLAYPQPKRNKSGPVTTEPMSEAIPQAGLQRQSPVPLEAQLAQLAQEWQCQKTIDCMSVPAICPAVVRQNQQEQVIRAAAAILRCER